MHSDGQLMRDGSMWSRRVKVTRSEQSNDDTLHLHWISQDWGLSMCLHASF